MGQAALPAVKKRRTAAKPAEHLGGIPSSQVYSATLLFACKLLLLCMSKGLLDFSCVCVQATDPLAAAQFDFVFGTGSTRRAQHGPQTALNAPPAGESAAP